MEKNENEKARLKEVQRLTFTVLIVMTVIILAYVIYGLVTKSMNLLLFGFLLGGFVVIYLAMTDIVEPYRLGLFRDLTPERRSGFLKMMLMDVIGAGALIYWIAGIDSESGGSILVPFLIYFLSVQMKRKFREEFEGIVPKDEAEGDAESSAEESGEQDGK